MKKYIPATALFALMLYLIYKLMEREQTKTQAKKRIQESEEEVFSPKPYAEGIWNDLNKWFFQPTSGHVYEDVVKLSDDELRAVWYYWEINYKPLKGEYNGYSLGAALDSTAFLYNADHVEIVKRLKSLNLN